MYLYFIAWGVKTTQKSNTQSTQKQWLVQCSAQVHVISFPCHFSIYLIPHTPYIEANIRHNILPRSAHKPKHAGLFNGIFPCGIYEEILTISWWIKFFSMQFVQTTFSTKWNVFVALIFLFRIKYIFLIFYWWLCTMLSK